MVDAAPEGDVVDMACKLARVPALYHSGPTMLRPKQPKIVRVRRSSEHRRNLRQQFRRTLGYMGLGISILSVGGSGCTRQAYRTKTNAEAYYLIDQKICESGEQTA